MRQLLLVRRLQELYEEDFEATSAVLILQNGIFFSISRVVMNSSKHWQYTSLGICDEPSPNTVDNACGIAFATTRYIGYFQRPALMILQKYDFPRTS